MTDPWVPLYAAAARFNQRVDGELLYNLLTLLIRDGKLGYRDPPVPGDPLVALATVEPIVQAIEPQQWRHLEGQPITVSQATAKYDVLSARSLLRWARQGHVRVVRNTYPLLLDEASVAFAAALYRQAGGKKRALFPPASR